MGKEPRLLDRVRAAIRTKHYSIRTEQANVDWIRRFILFHNKRHPVEMTKAEIEMFLTHLAVNRNVAPSTQNQVPSAFFFFIGKYLSASCPGSTMSLGRKSQVACRWFSQSPRSEDCSTNSPERNT
ncbi:MAG: phage integrase N-terminal SAM-like domain-containing protein [Candidatus Thiodiazotropha sp. (ex Clathrolucina costata)]|nr:phage integrase N-terminal SAM-like domain-containing protein [Candidatus Thiodiazotropha taylori]